MTPEEVPLLYGHQRFSPVSTQQGMGQGSERDTYMCLHVYQAYMRDRLPDASLMATEPP
jgi:hypothetical protein